MKLYIKLNNGSPVDHPILEDNLLQTFPGIDLSSSEEYKEFVRKPRPTIGVYEVIDNITYGKENEVYTDVYNIREMTAQEKLEKQNETKQNFASTGWVSWTFDENTCSHIPPIAHPEVVPGIEWFWSENVGNWLEVQPMPPPKDGKYYDLDLDTGYWIEKSK